MKLATGNPAAVREARVEQLRRDRASSQIIRAAFPSIQKLRLELTFSGSHPNIPAPQLYELYPPARAFFIYRCPYSGCDGHFDLSAAVNSAIGEKGHIVTGTMECGGSRPRDHLSRQTCLLHLTFDVKASVAQPSKDFGCTRQT